MPIPASRRTQTAGPWRKRLPALIIVMLAALLQPAPRPALADTESQPSAAVFDEAWRLVRDNFYDRTMTGLDWEAIGDRHRPSYLTASSTAARSKAINAMLAELKASHVGHYTADDPAYYQLVDIFRHGLGSDLGREFPGGNVSYPGIGIFTREVDGQTFVSGVLAGLPGAKAGLQAGDEILTVEGAPFEAVQPFRDKLGASVSMSIRRTAGGPVEVITLTPEQIVPGEAFRTSMREGARVIEAGGKKIGYIRVWSYASQDYQNILVEELSGGKLKDADALIWDLRDGWGGANPRYLDLFNARAPDMVFTERSGQTGFANFKWRKPVAMLINGGTRSGKEVLAYGFKKYGYGEVIGTRTAGALLAGRGFLLSDGSFLMVAVNDVTLDGERIEGKGVEPAIEVPFDLPYAGGRDPQLDKAIEVLTMPQAG